MFKRIREKLFGEPTIYLYSEETPEEEEVVVKNPDITKEREQELRDGIRRLNKEIDVLKKEIDKLYYSNYYEDDYGDLQEVEDKSHWLYNSMQPKHQKALEKDLLDEKWDLIRKRDKFLEELYV